MSNCSFNYNSKTGECKLTFNLKDFTPCKTVSNQEFIEKCTVELGGGFLASIESQILWEYYQQYIADPCHYRDIFMTWLHRSLESANTRLKLSSTTSS